VVKSEKK